jgi:hypothetical protein
MKISSIETTPNPNCMKLNLDELLSAKPVTLTEGNEIANVPQVARQLLLINGIRSIFLTSNFITLTRSSSAEWQPILVEAARLIGLAEDADSRLAVTVPESEKQKTTSESTPELGEVEVAIQVFRGIPVQVRVTGDGEQARFALPERFNLVLQRVIATTGANYISLRRWQPYGNRFGKPEEVARMVAEELASMIDEDELARIERDAIANRSEAGQVGDYPSQEELLAELTHPDWERRLKAIQKIEVNNETFFAVVAALDHERSAIRRWAAAILGGSGMPEAIEPLCKVVLSDASAIVRRTAGDALSDLGDARASGTMCQALEDRSKLMRWRAARFLNEVGDQAAVEPLQRAQQHESEFDVRVEMLAAIERIEGGGKAQMPMWMRIAKGVG